MRGNRRKDTLPELRLRRILHGAGLRYRVNHRPLPAERFTADIVFTRAKVAVFVDGCFWHGCPEHYRPATANADFWHSKLDENRERDRRTTQLLRESGWTVLRVWEHDSPEWAAAAVVEAVQRAGATRASGQSGQ